MDIDIRLYDDKWQGSVSDIYTEFSNGRTDIGAICTFTGLVRDFNDSGQVKSLVLEHYPSMAEKTLRTIAEKASQRWNLQKLWIMHRYGELFPSDVIVYVMAAAEHRGEAFESCQFVMDYLKVEAPFWKVEKTAEGGVSVAERASDKEAVKKWQN